MKKYLLGFLLLALLSLSSIASAAGEKQPLRVAYFPVIVESGYGSAGDVVNAVQKELDNAMHVPLNGFLQSVEYLPEEECIMALRAGMAENATSGGKGRYRDVMKQVAERLKADFVVCLVIHRCEQYTSPWFGGWYGRNLLHSYVSLSLQGYDRHTDTVFRKSANRSYHEEYSTDGLARQRAKDCMYAVLRETKLRELYHDAIQASREEEKDVENKESEEKNGNTGIIQAEDGTSPAGSAGHEKP